jgi:hypothetical protein
MLLIVSVAGGGRLSLDGFPDGRDFNFPPPDFATTPENSTHVYFKDIILPASDEARPVSRSMLLHSLTDHLWRRRNG